MKTNWQTKKLTELGKVCTGKWNANHAREKGKYAFFTCASKPQRCETKRFSGECLILPGNGVNVGDVYYYNGEFDAYQRTYVISDINADSKYLFYYLLAFWKERNLNKQYGSATNFLKIGNFETFEIPLPPLPTQKAIVKILDQVFESISKSKENAEKNLKNAKELFESYLEEIFSNPKEDWEEKKFEKCLEKVKYTTKIQKKDFLKDGKYPIVSQEQDLINGYWNKKEDLFEIKKPVVIFGDHTQILKYIDFDFVLGADGVKILQPVDKIDPLYFYYVMKKIRIQNLGYARHYRLLKEKMVPIPPISEQKTIVQKLDSLSSEIKQLEQIYAQKIKDLEELKKSMLQKAFSGELTKE